MAKRWRIHTHDQDRIATLERASGVPPVIAQLLVSRGITDPRDVQMFLAARLNDLRDPDLLPGMESAVQCIDSAVRAGRRIVIYGDYDADGMTATAILVRCLKLIGADVSYYVPNRLDEGYGLNDDALRKIAERGAAVVVSVDCGIASLAPAATARQLGIDLVITDHHEMGPELPDAVAIVHPRLPGTDYPFGGLCGAGVALKLAWSLCRRASGSKKVSDPLREFLLAAIGIAAIGTVADVVPLVDENRVLVRHGLSSLQRQPPCGLRELLRVTELDQRPALSSEDIAFTIAPRLNAAGRLGQAQLGVELLTTESPDRAKELAEYIHELNSSRDSLERKIYRAANEQVKEQFDPVADPALVLAGAGWHAGVIGIVAGRLAEKFHRPVVMIALDQMGSKPGSGSARTAGGVNLHEALAACGDRLLAHGGHAAAAGLKIDEAQVAAFRAEFCEYVARVTSPQDRIAEIRIDAEAPFAQLTLKTVQQIEQLSPFGAGNPRPVLCATDVRLADRPKPMGSGERHLSVRLSHHQLTMRAVAFGAADWLEPLGKVDGPVDVAFRPVVNEFRGRRSVELHLVDWRIHSD